jgi:hypothetical protein
VSEHDAFNPSPRFLADIDLIGRTGARNLELGYEGSESAPRWFAQVSYQDELVSITDKGGVEEAVHLLVRRLVSGGICTWCHGVARLDGDEAPGCRYVIVNGRYERGCAC